MFVIVLATRDDGETSFKVEGPYESHELVQEALTKMREWMNDIEKRIDDAPDENFDDAYSLVVERDEWLPLIYSETDYGEHTCEIVEVKHMKYRPLNSRCLLIPSGRL